LGFDAVEFFGFSVDGAFEDGETVGGRQQHQFLLARAQVCAEMGGFRNARDARAWRISSSLRPLHRLGKEFGGVGNPFAPIVEAANGPMSLWIAARSVGARPKADIPRRHDLVVAFVNGKGAELNRFGESCM